MRLERLAIRERFAIRDRERGGSCKVSREEDPEANEKPGKKPSFEKFRYAVALEG